MIMVSQAAELGSSPTSSSFRKHRLGNLAAKNKVPSNREDWWYSLPHKQPIADDLTYG